MVRRLFRAALIGFLFLAGGVAQAAGDYFEGVHYQRITPAQPVDDPARIEVREIFWYGCPHCYDFEPYVQKWLKKKPADVNFVRMPAAFRPLWELHAKAYYTAELLGVVDRIHAPFFHARHEARRKLATTAELADFFAEHGVGREEFLKTFNSFPVMVRVNRARQIIPRYGVSGVPSVIVAGKYRVGAGMVDSYGEMIKVIDYLVNREREAGGGGRTGS